MIQQLGHGESPLASARVYGRGTDLRAGFNAVQYLALFMWKTLTAVSVAMQRDSQMLLSKKDGRCVHSEPLQNN